MKHLKSIILLLCAPCFWSCDNYVVDPTPAPILIDRAINVYNFAREVRVTTQDARRVALSYLFSNSLYCDDPFSPSEQLSSECQQYVAVANSYGEKERLQHSRVSNCDGCLVTKLLVALYLRFVTRSYGSKPPSPMVVNR